MLEGLLGLRRVRELLPGNEDVIRGIAGIQTALGEAVPQRTAAKALGISHPELSKLVTNKDLTTVDTARGRGQISVESLVAYIESAGIGPREKPRWKQRREQRERDEAKESGDKAEDLQRILEMRALAFHRSLARNLDRATVDRAKEVLAEQRDHGAIDDEQGDEWAKVLELPVADVAARMTDYSDAGKALRRQSPFNSMGRRETD